MNYYKKMKGFRALRLALVTGFMLSGLGFAQPALADMVVERDKLLLGDDYKVFEVRDGAAGECKKACAKDRRCEAWTFIRPRGNAYGQCRLKRALAPGFKNGCCVSGYKKADEIEEDVRPVRNRQRQRCREWADQAISFNEENVSSKCGYRGRAWHSRKQRHVRRCMQLDRRGRQNELNGLKQAINVCQREVGFEKKVRCDHYARMAVNQDKSRVSAGCGIVQKTRWTNRYRDHLNWCLKSPKAEARREFEAREQVLRRCFAFEGNRSGPCHDYASLAIDHFRKNIQKGCDLHGVRWHNNYRRHFRWCKGVSAKSRRREIDKRRITLKTCKLFGKFGIQWK